MAIDPIWKAATAIWAGWTAASVKQRIDAHNNQPFRIENVSREIRLKVWEGLMLDEPKWRRLWDEATRRDKEAGGHEFCAKVAAAMNARINGLVEDGIVDPS